MIQKRIRLLAGISVLLIGCSNPDLLQKSVTIVKEQQQDNLSSETIEFIISSNEETEESREQREDTMVGKMDTTSTSISSELLEMGYELIEKEEAKKGEFPSSEMGLYWDRYLIQRIFYTDVQEICENAFGDYLSPLQGLTGLLRHYEKRYRTDKETAIVGSGHVEFHIFLENAVALVIINDKGKTYETSFRILREEEAKGIKILEVPPLNGIGIAGSMHKPEKPNYSTHTAVTYEGETEYTKADIQLVFYRDVQCITEEVFGDYVQALQGLFILTEQEGYGDYAFSLEDLVFYLKNGYFETTIIKDNFCEFTVFLAIPDRARVTITKEGNKYTTSFRLLKDEEFETEPHAG